MLLFAGVGPLLGGVLYVLMMMGATILGWLGVPGFRSSVASDLAMMAEAVPLLLLLGFVVGVVPAAAAGAVAAAVVPRRACVALKVAVVALSGAVFSFALNPISLFGAFEVTMRGMEALEGEGALLPLLTALAAVGAVSAGFLTAFALRKRARSERQAAGR